MSYFNYKTLRQYYRRLKRNARLRKRNFFRKPSLRTPDIESTEYIWQEIFNQRIYAHPHLQIHEEPLDVVVDVGANIGLFAAWAAEEYSPRHIYSYEASPVTYRYLQRNSKKLARAHKTTSFHPIHAAVSHTNGDQIEIYHRPHKIGASTLMKQGDSMGGIPHKVRTVSLSRELLKNEIEKVDLLKIDVEGHYLQVLQGISDFTKIRRIVLECDWIPQGAPSRERVVTLLENEGYTVQLDDPDKQNNITVYARQTLPDSITASEIIADTQQAEEEA